MTPWGKRKEKSKKKQQRVRRVTATYLYLQPLFHHCSSSLYLFLIIVEEGEGGPSDISSERWPPPMPPPRLPVAGRPHNNVHTHTKNKRTSRSPSPRSLQINHSARQKDSKQRMRSSRVRQAAEHTYKLSTVTGEGEYAGMASCAQYHVLAG